MLTCGVDLRRNTSAPYSSHHGRRTALPARDRGSRCSPCHSPVTCRPDIGWTYPCVTSIEQRPVPTPARTRAGGRRDWSERFEQMTTPPRVQPARSAQPALSIGVVGAGRVGAVLAARLQEAGHRITGVAGESDASRERAATL